MVRLSRVALSVTALATLLAAGCGDVEPRGKLLHGRVTIDGAPVTAGNLLLVSENGVLTATAPLRGDGTYEVKGPPLGRVKIAVQTLLYRDRAQPPKSDAEGPAPEPGAAGSAGMVLPPPSERGLVYKAIPEKYEDVETSGLSAVIEPGDQTFDLALTTP